MSSKYTLVTISGPHGLLRQVELSLQKAALPVEPIRPGFRNIPDPQHGFPEDEAYLQVRATHVNQVKEAITPFNWRIRSHRKVEVK